LHCPHFILHNVITSVAGRISRRPVSGHVFRRAKTGR
jgi:hypothetical protein